MYGARAPVCYKELEPNFIDGKHSLYLQHKSKSTFKLFSQLSAKPGLFLAD